MQSFKPEVISIADACLGSLRGRSALIVGPEELRRPYVLLLEQANVEHVYQEDTPRHISPLLPSVQLLLSIPSHNSQESTVSAVSVAMGCHNRQTPLFIFDLAENSSVEEMVELLPMVCLYTPDDLRRMLMKKRRYSRIVRDSSSPRKQVTSIARG